MACKVKWVVRLLSLPGVLKAMLSWQQREGDGLEDFFDGEFCKSHPLFLKEISLPILLYNDDCETVNPLGSKTGIHKLGFLYFSIKSLPPQLLSSLKSQFLLAVYKADDVKTYGLDAILRPIVEEIKCLETNGIRITSPDFQGVVKCTIAQVVGDNLGLNAILGYIESFSGHHVCRWCSVERTVLRTMTSEDSVLMRSRASHQDDLTIGNPTLTGLKRDSFLNNLNFYHVTDNVAPDVMHDILEGIGPYEVKLILNSLIENNHLTLDKLNYRITSFDYGFADKRNKPSVISKHDLRNIDGAMCQSAAQSWCLLRLLPLMVGDLVPHGCKEWHLLLLLLSCMELLFSPSLTQPAVQYLGKIIEEHHTLFLELFPHRHLRPKHHCMIHYPSAIQKLGPLVQYWAMRPTADTKMALAASLVEAFPLLKDASETGFSTWYTKERHHRPATGFLEERLRNIRKRICQLRDPEPTQRSTQGSAPAQTIPDSPMPLEMVLERIEWLKNNSQPLIQVEEFMRDTALYRARWVRDNANKTILDVLEKFPHLTTPGMIALDFQILHPEAAMCLFQRWTPDLVKKMLDMAVAERKLLVPLAGLGQGNVT
ncbi:hypothetical protein N1851_027341 [Merluccius polli]|uniref:Uncharacterized protein n=1 Tax=Merluccius polli TaxID=89951 RepID=A0AA47NTA2_MERPO|nr:hypothetical protein N1851_027341 [Merluccius polli]